MLCQTQLLIKIPLGRSLPLNIRLGPRQRASFDPPFTGGLLFFSSVVSSFSP